MKKLMLVLFFTLITAVSFAETITLKSGNVVEGTIVERTDDFIKVDRGVGITVTYYLDEIESIGKNKNLDSTKLLNQEYGNNVTDEVNGIKQYLEAVESIYERLENGSENGILEGEKQIKIALDEAALLMPLESYKKHKELLVAAINSDLDYTIKVIGIRDSLHDIVGEGLKSVEDVEFFYYNLLNIKVKDDEELAAVVEAKSFYCDSSDIKIEGDEKVKLVEDIKSFYCDFLNARIISERLWEELDKEEDQINKQYNIYDREGN